MKAFVYTKYGSPEVVHLKEVAQPEPNDHEVLVKVHASTVNRTDCGFRSAEYFISRFWSGLFRPNNQILGCEFAGTVVETGKQVTTFKKGDQVFGYDDDTFGGHAEYKTMAEQGAITHLPNNLNFQESAPMTEGAHYALNNIRAAKVEKGQNVMVYGATGAIGSAAVQLLKYFDTKVTAVCNTKNVDLVQSLDADEVIDYQTEDFTKTDNKFHFVFDAVGKTSFRECQPLLTKTGIYISTELGRYGVNLLYALITPILGGNKVLFPIPTIDKEDVVFLKELVEQDEYKPVIDREYPFDQIIDAYRYVETGQKTGNVVLNVVK